MEQVNQSTTELILFENNPCLELEFVLDRDHLLVPGDFRRVVRLDVFVDEEDGEELHHAIAIEKHDLPLDVYCANIAFEILRVVRYPDIAGPELYEVIASHDQVIMYLHDELKVHTETTRDQKIKSTLM